MREPLLELRNLKTQFFTREGVVKAVDGVSFEIPKKEILGLVGETGCGKSVTALSIIGLVPHPGKIVGGEVIFEGENLLEKNKEEMRRVRGKKISMIFQDPENSLNPVYTIYDQIAEAVELHQKIEHKKIPEKVAEILGLAGIPDPSDRMAEYPHQFSGGMKQRAMIAMMLSCNPSLLIADEPTTALDVTIQMQILKLMTELRRKLGTSILFITHNLGVIAETCDRVAVMYAGNIVEQADVKTLFKSPKHPYTRALLKTILERGKQRGELQPISGTVPNLIHPPRGCKFHPRCPHAREICRRESPKPVRIGKRHVVRCHLYGGGASE